MHVCANPQPKINAGIRIRCGTFTIKTDENGCHASCAIGAIDPTKEYSLPFSFVSSRSPNNAPYPRTDLSKIYDVLAWLAMTLLSSVTNLQEVYPNQNREHDLISLAT